MLHRKGIIHCPCANTLYLAQQFNETNVTSHAFQQISSLKFFLNDSAGRWKCCGRPHADRGPVIGHTGWIKLWLCSLLLAHSVACCMCKLVEICLRFISDFWVNKGKAVFALSSFHNSSAQFLSLRAFLAGSCPIIVVNLQVCFSLLERVSRVSKCRVFAPLLMFWQLSVLKLQLISRKCSKNGHLTSLWWKSISDSQSVENISD